MKNWTWKQWTALGIIVAVIITIIVLHLVQPVISYAFAEIMTIIGFGLGCLTGYMFKGKTI